MTGRGAWPNSGKGGTLKTDGINPGPYYVLAKQGDLVGKRGWNDPDINYRAVRGGVLAIQRALNRRFSDGDIKVTGRFDKPTAELVAEFQRLRMPGQNPWGGVGPDTAKALFGPDLKRACKQANFEHTEVICGLIKNESNFDPGAVGYLDPDDLGMGQINGTAHPEWDEKERLRPIRSFEFMIEYMEQSLDEFDGNIRDAIASYNLGRGGTRTWISRGRPDTYLVGGSAEPRLVNAYIDRILTACSN